MNSKVSVNPKSVAEKKKYRIVANLLQVIRFPKSLNISERRMVLKALEAVVLGIPDKRIVETNDLEVLYYFAKLNEGIPYDKDYPSAVIKKAKGYHLKHFINKVEEIKRQMRDEGVEFQWHLVVPIISKENNRSGGISALNSKIDLLQKALLQKEDEMSDLYALLNENKVLKEAMK